MPQGKQQQGAFDIQSAGQGGPFSQYLDPSQTAPQWSDGQKPNGWEHKTGGIAYIGTQLLQGITNGRVQAYAKKERERLQTFDRLTQQLQAVQSDPDVDPQLKAQLQKQYIGLLGSAGQEQLKDSKSSKDKGVRGQIAGVLNSVFEKMSGGPMKGDALTVDKMADFMGTVTKAVQSGASASSAYQKQLDLIQTGIGNAKKNVDGKWTQPTYEQIIAQPEVRQGLSWFQQYAPSQLTLATQLISGYPSQTNLKERAGAELANSSQATARTAAPPPTGSPRIAAPGSVPPSTAQAAPPSGYLQGKYPDTPPAAPPATQGKKSPADQEDEEWKQQLGEWAGVQQDVPYTDKNGNMSMVTPKIFQSLATQRRLEDSEGNHRDIEADKKDKPAKQDNSLLGQIERAQKVIDSPDSAEWEKSAARQFIAKEKPRPVASATGNAKRNARFQKIGDDHAKAYAKLNSDLAKHPGNASLATPDDKEAMARFKAEETARIESAYRASIDQANEEYGGPDKATAPPDTKPKTAAPAAAKQPGVADVNKLLGLE